MLILIYYTAQYTDGRANVKSIAHLNRFDGILLFDVKLIIYILCMMNARKIYISKRTN